MCGNCKGGYEDYCTGNDPYAGYEGAFECMASKAGDVAFVRDSTIGQATSNSSYVPEVRRDCLYLYQGGYVFVPVRLLTGYFKKLEFVCHGIW